MVLPSSNKGASSETSVSLFFSHVTALSSLTMICLFTIEMFSFLLWLCKSIFKSSPHKHFFSSPPLFFFSTSTFIYLCACLCACTCVFVRSVRGGYKHAMGGLKSVSGIQLFLSPPPNAVPRSELRWPRLRVSAFAHQTIWPVSR